MAEAAPRVTKLTGYFMHVELLVAAADAPAFEARLAAFLNGSRRPFARLDSAADYELVLALKTTEPFAFTASGHGRFTSSEREAASADADPPGASRCRDARLGVPMYRYVHLWTVPDQADLDLANIMIRSADDTPYMQVDALVSSESQEFVRLVQRPGYSLLPTNTGKCVRIIRCFPSKHLGAYIFRSGILLPVLTQQGWVPCGQFQNVTGKLNTVTEFWQTENSALDAKSMYDALSAPDDELRRRVVDDVQHRLPFSELRETFEIPDYFKALGKVAA